MLLNLQRAQSNPIVQKLIVVSDSAQIEKIKKESTALPEAFKRSISYWDADEVDSTHEHLGQVSTSIAKLDLVADTFK